MDVKVSKILESTVFKQTDTSIPEATGIEVKLSKEDKEKLEDVEHYSSLTSENTEDIVTVLKKGFGLDEFEYLKQRKDTPSSSSSSSSSSSLLSSLGLDKLIPRNLSSLFKNKLVRTLGKAFGVLTGAISFGAGYMNDELREKLFGKNSDSFAYKFLTGTLNAVDNLTFGILDPETVMAGAKKIQKNFLDPFTTWANKIGTEIDKMFFSWALPKEETQKNIDNANQAIEEKSKEVTEDAVKTTNSLFDKLTSSISAFVKSIIDKLPEPIKKFVNWVGDTISSEVEGAKEVVREVSTNTRETYRETKETIEKAATTAYETGKDWVLGKSVQHFESGKAGAGAVSTGRGDAGGASYGTYQLSSTRGTLQRFLNSSGYGEQFAGLRPGTAEFNAKWKEIAARDTNFGKAQRSFIKQTHYDPQMRALQRAGIDLSKRGAAVQDSIWSTSVQFGGSTSLVKDALRGKDVSRMSDEEIVSAIQDYKIANNDRLFKSSSAAVRAGTLRRARAEKAQLVAMSKGSGSIPVYTGVGKKEEPIRVASTRSTATVTPMPTVGSRPAYSTPGIVAARGGNVIDSIPALPKLIDKSESVAEKVGQRVASAIQPQPNELNIDSIPMIPNNMDLARINMGMV